MLYEKKQKAALKPFFTARDFLSLKNISFKVPQNVIMLPFSGRNEYIKSLSKKTYSLLSDIDILSTDTAAATNFGLGAPLTAVLAELLAALGAKNFILLGVAGGLDARLQIADAVLCSGAFCDEGTSPNYTSRDYAPADEELLNKLTPLRCALKAPTWTTDALFRETQEEVVFYAKQGAATVEMEAAALFAFAQNAGLKAAGIFIISDLLTKEVWHLPQGKDAKTALEQKLKEIIKILG
jgi:uridine phosphorylase